MGKRTSDDGYKYYQEITSEGLVDVIELPPENRFKEYSYCGDVYQYGKVVLHKFKATTFAVSEAKAKQNILFQAKNKLNLKPSTGGFVLETTPKLTN